MLHTSDGDEVTKEVRVAAMGRTSGLASLWKPERVGDVTLTLEVPTHGDETLTDNNRLTAPISIREEKLRVLVIESYPRWEYRYLRNALSRDPGVDVSCLLFHPGLSKVGGGSKDYIQQFPAGLDELSRFDVVFLGDVGLERRPADRRAVRLPEGPGRAAGQRHRFHARLAGTAVFPAGHRAGRPLSRRARRHATERLGIAHARATSNSPNSAAAAC